MRMAAGAQPPTEVYRFRETQCARSTVDCAETAFAADQRGSFRERRASKRLDPWNQDAAHATDHWPLRLQHCRSERQSDAFQL